MNTQHWLASVSYDRYENAEEIKLIDGPHSDVVSVTEAKEIIQRIGLDKNLNRNYKLVTISDVPDLTVNLNEEAITRCKHMTDELHRGNLKE